MGCRNQVRWIERHRGLVRGPILEVGSKRYKESDADLRTLFPGEVYTGIDLQEGQGVDAVLDLSREDVAIVPRAGYRTVICLSVLEHCEQPWVMAEHIMEALTLGGVLFVSAPFSWKLHAYPKDYWRFTPDGIRALFPAMDFDLHAGEVCSNVTGYTSLLSELPRWAVLHGDGILRDYHYTLPPTLVSMIGVRR